MKRKVDFTRKVRYELMLGREATEAISARPVAFLPVGCLERHGDHLPMGLDIIKAHRACCVAAQALGGVVFPPHFYSGVHAMTEEQIRHFTGDWGNIYTDATAEEHLLDVIRQIRIAGIRALVLYTGHYAVSQGEMVARIGDRFADERDFAVIPFSELMILKGDHAGVSETSLLLYLDRPLVDMTRIGEINYRDHGWSDETTPEKASAARGEAEMEQVLAHLEKEIAKHLPA